MANLKKENQDNKEKKIEKNVFINSYNDKCITVVVVENGEIQRVDVQVDDTHQQKQKKSTIYMGSVESVTPHLNAAFVKLDSDKNHKNGFMSCAEVAPEYWDQECIGESSDDINIKKAVKEGQNLLVQVLKEERGTKGAAVSTYITLPGCYLVLLPNKPSAGGISRQVVGQDREKLKDLMKNLKIPSHMGLILRTASTTRTQQELQWELDVLLYQWNKIQQTANSKTSPSLVYEEGDIYLRTIRDYLQDADSIIVDSKHSFDKISQYLKIFREDFISKLSLYEGKQGIFNHYRIDNQVESLFSKSVSLQNGATIVFNQTEALTAIDVNSARANKGNDIEETARNTNLEAAQKISSLIKVMKISGLIVIDFIDMENDDNKKAVEKLMNNALSDDKVKNHVGSLSVFCTMQISRQRECAPVVELLYKECPVCHTPNSCPNDAYASNILLADIQKIIKNKKRNQINVYTSYEFSYYLLNICRDIISKMEHDNGVRIVITADSRMLVNNYSLEELPKRNNNIIPSSIPIQASNVSNEHMKEKNNNKEEKNEGIFSKIYSTFFGPAEKKELIDNKSKNRRRNDKYRRNYRKHIPRKKIRTENN